MILKDSKTNFKSLSKMTKLACSRAWEILPEHCHGIPRTRTQDSSSTISWPQARVSNFELIISIL